MMRVAGCGMRVAGCGVRGAGSSSYPFSYSSSHIEFPEAVGSATVPTVSGNVGTAETGGHGGPPYLLIVPVLKEILISSLGTKSIR